MPLCYRYDLETLCFVGAEEMVRNTSESEKEGRDIWILPAECTETPPPEAKEGFKIKWNGEKWYYKKEPRTTFEIGEIITDEDMDEYTAAAQWCNENGAMIEEIGEKGESPRQFQIKKFEIATEELKAQVRAVRDTYMQTTQNRIDRYRNQKELGVETKDGEEVYKQLLEYMQYLRDYPSGKKWWNKNPMIFDAWVVSTSELIA